MRDLALSEARNQNGMESIILGLANALADAGYVVEDMVEAAQAAGRAAPASSAGTGPSSDADKAKIAELEAKLAAAASGGAVPATPRDEKDAAIKALETKLAQLEAASSSIASVAYSPQAGGDAALQKELAETKALLVAKENDCKKQIAEAHEAERAAKAKLHEQNDELQSLRDSSGVKNTDTPADDHRLHTLQDQVAQLEKEKAQLKGQTTQLQGQLDLAKAEAAKANTKSGSCQVQ